MVHTNDKIVTVKEHSFKVDTGYILLIKMSSPKPGLDEFMLYEWPKNEVFRILNIFKMFIIYRPYIYKLDKQVPKITRFINNDRKYNCLCLSIYI